MPLLECTTTQTTYVDRLEYLSHESNSTCYWKKAAEMELEKATDVRSKLQLWSQAQVLSSSPLTVHSRPFPQMTDADKPTTSAPAAEAKTNGIAEADLTKYKVRSVTQIPSFFIVTPRRSIPALTCPKTSNCLSDTSPTEINRPRLRLSTMLPKSSSSSRLKAPK